MAVTNVLNYLARKGIRRPPGMYGIRKLGSLFMTRRLRSHTRPTIVNPEVWNNDTPDQADVKPIGETAAPINDTEVS